jgi:hypothetical protein
VSHFLKQIDERWKLTLLSVTGLIQSVQISRALFSFKDFAIAVEKRVPLNLDAAIFEHGGWYITQGAVPYINIWDIKPPLTMGTTTILALISGGDMFILHVLSVLLTSTLMIGTLMMLGILIHRVTGSGISGIAAGLSMMALPGFSTLAILGFRPKYPMLLLGLLSIHLMLERRPFLAGVCAAAATGFILHGTIFPIMVGFMAIQHRDWRGLRRSLAGMALTTLIVITPILLWNAFIPMLVEVLFAPLLVAGKNTFQEVLMKFTEHTKYTILLAPLGAVGLTYSGLQDLRERWWFVLGALFFGYQVVFLDFDGFPDLFGLWAFLSLGVGLITAASRSAFHLPIGAVVLALALVSSIWLGGFGHLYEEISPPTPIQRASDDERAGLPNMPYIFWNKVRPPTCHYRLSIIEWRWMELTEQPLFQEACETHWASHFGDLFRLK